MIAPQAGLDRAERIDRMRSRSWALQVLYAWDAAEPGRTDPSSELDRVRQTRRIADRRLPFIRALLSAVGSNLAAIDDVLERAVDNWRLHRLSRVDRSILRLAVAEMLFVPATPRKVALQEGIRLAGQYGGEESPRFVNGVLDAVLNAVPPDVSDDPGA